jgi:hypothetical protein
MVVRFRGRQLQCGKAREIGVPREPDSSAQAPGLFGAKRAQRGCMKLNRCNPRPGMREAHDNTPATEEDGLWIAGVPSIRIRLHEPAA